MMIFDCDDGNDNGRVYCCLIYCMEEIVGLMRGLLGGILGLEVGLEVS